MHRFTIAAFILLIPVGASGQETVRSVIVVDPQPQMSPPAPSWLQQQQLPPPGMKSPGLAAVLNLFIPYGVGNFYAGSESHGVRHLALGLGSVGLMVGGLVAACDDSLTLCDEESAGFYVAGAGGLLFFTNWVWGIVSGIGDAKAHNRMVREAYSLRPSEEQEPVEERNCDPLTQAERWEAYWNPEILEEWRRRCGEGGDG